MCQPAVPSDTPGSRISCNLCHNHQSDTNRCSICLSARDPTNPHMTKPLKLRPICSEETPLPSPGRLQKASQCNAHSRYWFSGTCVGAAFTFRCRSVRDASRDASSKTHSQTRPFLYLNRMIHFFFLFFFFPLCSLNNGVRPFQKNEAVLNGRHESGILFNLSWCEAFSSRWHFFVKEAR